jgi:hypothetical protein
MTYATLRAAAEHIARTGQITPHQLAALDAAWERMSDADKREFTDGWRAQGSPAAPPTAGPVTWDSMIAMARQAGARFPELVAAQGALESAWYKSPSGQHNYFGLKGTGTTKETQEFIDGQWVTIRDSFLDFRSPQEAVAYLVDRWYKDFRGHKGVNNAPTREAAARMLVSDGYATDPDYATKLIQIMSDRTPRPPLQQSGLPAPTPAERSQWVTQIKALNISQPDESTCQAACIAMAVGDRDVAKIRRNLQARGAAGDPAVMAHVIRSYGRPYRYEGNASLARCYEWLKAGEFLITHGWFTRSGHVICLDGLKRLSNSYTFDVKDPWSEFNVQSWRYDLGSRFYDGFYSDLLIYATCVASSNVGHAQQLYQSGRVDPNRGGMWVHRFMTAN